MFLFRRRGREKDGTTGEQTEAPAASAPAAERSTPVAAAPPPRPATPPPLPQRPPDANPSGEARAKFPTCFVCHTPLEAGRCPVCKIAWVE